MKNFLLYSVLFLTFACSYTQKINSGDMAFERKQFAVAVNMLPDEYQKEKSTVNKGKIAYKIGESYNRMNQNDKAVDWYETAYNNGYGIDALKAYSYALKKAGRYKEAKTSFKELGIEIGSPYEYRKEISACDIAQGWIDNQALNPYRVKDAGLNSSDADYAPIILQDGEVLFTSDRQFGSDGETYNWTGNGFSNFWEFNAQNFESNPFSDRINSANNEGTATFSKDYKTIIFSRCFAPNKEDRYCKLMSSTLEDGDWSEPAILNFTKPEINYGHPSLSSDGKRLYFSSNDPDGWGGYDIYMAQHNAEGNWAEPKLLSRSINTEKDDKFPYIDADTLYFASEGHTGMGGLDVFKSFIQNQSRWTPAQNLLPPINSPADDFGIVVDYTNPLEGGILQQGYLTSSRINGQGGDDIYKFSKVVIPPPVVAVVDTIETVKPKEIEYKLILNGYVVEQIFKDPNNPNSQVIGRRPIPLAKVDINVDGKSIDKISVDENGFFSITLEEETDYYLFGSKDGYLNNSNRFSSKGIGKIPSNPTQEFEVEIVLDKIFKNQEIVLDNIYYDLDKWDIRLDAEPTLNSLYNTLQQNPNVNIQLNSHTDCQGQDQYNQNLSQKRAQSAIEYLIKKGISEQRLSAVGYGETRLAIDCACTKCSDEEHQANRRTTFTIVE